MFDILTIIPGKKKLTTGGWYSLNAVCCHHRGHNADRKSRGGILLTNDGFRWHCFNCNYSCSFKLGHSISKGTRDLLSWVGVDDEQIQQWNLESLKHRDLITELLTKESVTKRVVFKEQVMPPGARLLEQTDTWAIDYLASRKINWKTYPFMITPDDALSRNKRRIIVPYTYKDKIVGHTSKYCDNTHPKYINEQQPGYVFGLDLQHQDWQVCILVEGIFDALRINGCAYLHNTISTDQARLLSTMNKRIIVCPDQDKAGLTVIDRALELGYSVSLPPWEGCKDANDAVIKYGAFATVLSIIESATTSPITIKMRKRDIK